MKTQTPRATTAKGGSRLNSNPASHANLIGSEGIENKGADSIVKESGTGNGGDDGGAAAKTDAASDAAGNDGNHVLSTYSIIFDHCPLPFN